LARQTPNELPRIGIAASTYPANNRFLPDDKLEFGILFIRLRKYHSVRGRMVPETVLSTAAPHRPFYRTAGILIQRERPPGSPVLRVTLFLCGLRTENLAADPWAMSAVPDFVYAETTGKPPEDLEQRLKFQKGLSQLAAQEAAVFEMLVEVRHLPKPLKLLEDPAIADRINREVSSEVVPSHDE
jgi:hypothetical protein